MYIFCFDPRFVLPWYFCFIGGSINGHHIMKLIFFRRIKETYVTHNSQLGNFSAQATSKTALLYCAATTFIYYKSPFLYTSLHFPLPFYSLFSGDPGEKWKYAV